MTWCSLSKSPPILWIPEEGLLVVEAAARITRLLPLAHLQQDRDVNNFSSQQCCETGTVTFALAKPEFCFTRCKVKV
jgi:hypothetical protein